MSQKNPRYQVLHQAVAPKTGLEIALNTDNKTEALRLVLRLHRQGVPSAHVWDTQDNPISDLFRLA